MPPASNYLGRFPRILVADCAVCEFVAEAFSSVLGLPSVAFKTSDELLAALKLARKWWQRTGLIHHQEMIIWFFEFGANCYANNQPQFLAAFIEDTLLWIA